MGERWLCRVVGHRWGLFKAYRRRPSVIHQIRCTRCGSQQAGRP